MKNKILLFTLIFAVSLVASCKKKEVYEVIQAEEIQFSGTRGHGFVLLVNGGFYTIEKDNGEETDQSKWVASMSLGERVYTGQPRRATFVNNAGASRIYDYIEITRDTGVDGFGIASNIAVGGRLAVVTDDKGANLFRSPKTVDVSSVILSYKTIVVCYPETQTDGYIQVKAYDPVRQAFVAQDNNYVRVNTLSQKNSDIQSSILMQTALLLQDSGQQKIRRDALLESALLDHPDSVFYAEIMQIVHPNSSGVITAPSRFKDKQLEVNDNNVNVRDLPDTATGRVVGFVHKGDKVTVQEETPTTHEVNGLTSVWFKISEPVEGWVFGAFLDY